MVQSCLRTKVCKLCWTFLLVFLCCVSLALWFRAVQEGSVQLVIPGEPPDIGGLTITILPEEPVVREGDTAQLVCIATGTDYYPTPLHTYRLLPNTFTYLQITTQHLYIYLQNTSVSSIYETSRHYM
ncbi:hypothetical protein GBAR_LOCUS30226, partial [Geodia barretti]